MITPKSPKKLNELKKLGIDYRYETLKPYLEERIKQVKQDGIQTPIFIQLPFSGFITVIGILLHSQPYKIPPVTSSNLPEMRQLVILTPDLHIVQIESHT